MLIHAIKLNNFLSFGDAAETIPLGPLNVIVGPNGSRKSNLLESIELLRGAPDQLLKPIREGGGVRDWLLWKGVDGRPTASLDGVVANLKGSCNLRYALSFTEVGQRFQIVDERVENEKADHAIHPQPNSYYQFNHGHPTLNVKGKNRALQQEDIDVERSILAQRRDPDQYPEITYLAESLPKIRICREWSFGRYTAPRLPQKADLPDEFLEPDGSNLGLVLNRLRRDPAVKAGLLAALKALYDGIDDYNVQIEGGTVQVFFQEGRFTVPATRLSDGTLRYLCLLAILCHPNPPPLACIEEPELGLHPDVLADALADTPESVLMTEKDASGTVLRRLDAAKLKPWLEKYRLGQLWTRCEIGGTRW